MIIQERFGSGGVSEYAGRWGRPRSPRGKKTKQNTCLFKQFTSIFTVLNAIIQLCSRANLSHTRPQIVPPSSQRGCRRAGSLLLPKQLHANLQCEMSIRLFNLIGRESPTSPQSNWSYIISQSFLTFSLQPPCTLQPQRSAPHLSRPPSAEAASSSSFQPPFSRLAPWHHGLSYLIACRIECSPVPRHTLHLACRYCYSLVWPVPPQLRLLVGGGETDKSITFCSSSHWKQACVSPVQDSDTLMFDENSWILLSCS